MLKGIIATVLIAKDLARCTAFYRDTLKLQYLGTDANSSTFQLPGQVLILLSISGAAELLDSAPQDLTIDGASRVILAAGVEDVDAAYQDLKAKGVSFLRPPIDQPWGLRTAHLIDPEGNIWEINQPLETKPEG